MRQEKQTIGWREWVSLPALGIPAIKAKIDTGARTSCLHAFNLACREEGGSKVVCFGIHPLQKRLDVELSCRAEVIDQRLVRDSGGHSEERYVIRTPIRLGEYEWDVEITLTSRDDMAFRMLLGRTALRGRFVVDAAKSYLVASKRSLKAYNS